MALDAALGAAHALASDAPQQSLTLVAISGRRGCPHLEVMRGGAGDGVYESLEGLLVDMNFLREHRGEGSCEELEGTFFVSRFCKTRTNQFFVM